MKTEHPNRQENDINNEKLPFIFVFTGKIQQELPVPRKALVMTQFYNLRTGEGLCMKWKFESGHINMPLVIIALLWLFSRAFKT